MKAKRVLSTLVAAVTTAAILAGCGSAGAGGSSTDFSNQSVTCIVPYDAGGGTDTVMRAWADAAKGSFKNITVENRSGAGGATGMLAGATAKADGTTITMITVELTTLEAMGTNAGLTYSMFKPIMMVNSACSAITVKADDSRFETLEDLIAYSKSNELQMGNSGNGAIWHLAAAGLAETAGTDFKHVAYDGAAGAITDLLGGHIDAVAVSYAEVASYVESGDLKVLAVMSDNRLESIPDVPTCKECGYDAVLGTWRGIGVPADTSDEVVDALYQIFSDAANSTEFKEFMANSNNVIEIMDGKTFEERIKKDLDIYTGLVENLGLKVQ
ncbi:MAG: tripartite tricarboxylate transporter substrate binding protein [Clostridium sp.]|nr:tripartite tricarboxylate transporter substrate binding protein [Clostridium sp.]